MSKAKEALREVPSDVLRMVTAWIAAESREIRANTGDIMSAKRIVDMLTEELTGRGIRTFEEMQAEPR